MALRPLIAGSLYDRPAASSPAGASGTLQYNNGGAFGGITGWTTDGANALTGGAGTTLAVGNAAIGSNVLAVGGASLFTGASVVELTALGTTPTAGHSLINTTAAAAGAQQVSPSLLWNGKGWKTDATAASQAVEFRANVLPVQGSANPTGTWQLQSSINGGAFTNRLTVTSAGVVVAGSAIAAGVVYFDTGFLTQAIGAGNGILTLYNNAGNNWDRLQFGGTSSSFPSLKRSTTALQCRLADDSNYAPFAASAYSAGATAGVTAGPFTTITSITVVGGIVTDLQGS